MNKYTLDDIASVLGEVVEGDADWIIHGVASLSLAQAHDIACIHPVQSPVKIPAIRAEAVLSHASFLPYCPGMPWCVMTHSRLCMNLFHSSESNAGIDSSARAMAKASLGKNCRIGAHSVMGDGWAVA